MTIVESNNKRIARNTFFLYVRMLVSLFIGLYTSRIVLKALGVEDYGVYSLIAGVVSLLAYVNSLLSQGTSRFLTIELGKGIDGKLAQLFKSCLTLHILIAAFTLIIGESIGLWFLNSHLNIEPDRMFAANIVYQCALFSSVLTLIQAPFQASIISHEEMNVYAYMSIYDVAMKLLIALSLLYSHNDNLILYAVLTFAVSSSNILIYNIYCRNKFVECRFSIGLDKGIAKSIFGFMSWNAVESFAWMLNAQGFNILLNQFFSTVVNAAIGLIRYISGAINMFISNFQTSSRPQIFKYYAQGEIEQMNKLISNISRFSSYIMIIMTVPVIIETAFIYKFWLGDVPDYTVPFLRLTIVEMLFFSMSTPLIDGIKAVGRLKDIGIVSAAVYISFIAIWYVCLKGGVTPVQAFCVFCIQTPVMLCVNLYFLSRFTSFRKQEFFKKVVLKSFVIFLISLPLPYMIHMTMSEGWGRFIVVCVTSLLLASTFVLYIGLDGIIRNRIWNYIKTRLNKLPA